VPLIFFCNKVLLCTATGNQSDLTFSEMPVLSISAFRSFFKVTIGSDIPRSALFDTVADLTFREMLVGYVRPE